MPTITPLHPLFAARIGGLDLTRDLDDATFAAVRDEIGRASCRETVYISVVGV